MMAQNEMTTGEFVNCDSNFGHLNTNLSNILLIMMKLKKT